MTRFMNFRAGRWLAPSKIPWWLISLGTFLWAGCQLVDVTCDKECQDGWVDGGNHRDTCADDSNKTCLVSRRFSAPDSAKKNTPVIIAAHGFTATTYEWDEFGKFADTLGGGGKVLVSKVLLGGHGRNIDTFQNSTWREWGKPILEEYDSLVSKGYTHISLAGSSTGATLLLQYLADGSFNAGPLRTKVQPRWFFFIDPLVVPTAKLLSLANIVGPLLGNSPNPGDSTENAHWYVNRPEEDLRQLYSLANRVKYQLEDGFNMPTGSQAKEWKSEHDNSADPVSALFVYKGLRNSAGGHIQAEMVDSRLHVFTRLQGRRSPPSHADTLLQQTVFGEIASDVQFTSP